VDHNHADQRETPNDVYRKCSLSVRSIRRMHKFSCPVCFNGEYQKYTAISMPVRLRKIMVAKLSEAQQVA
jgi:hypothetical protein